LINHVWTVLCSKSSIDNDSNNISLFEVLEQVSVEVPPGVQISDEGINVALQFEMISLWSRSDINQPEKGEARFDFRAPSGRTQEGKIVEINLTEYERFRTRQRFSSIPLDSEGVYEFHVHCRPDPGAEWSSVANVPLHVVLRQQPPAEVIADPESAD
jgi:hypothetical protein